MKEVDERVGAALLAALLEARDASQREIEQERAAAARRIGDTA